MWLRSRSAATLLSSHLRRDPPICRLRPLPFRPKTLPTNPRPFSSIPNSVAESGGAAGWDLGGEAGSWDFGDGATADPFAGADSVAEGDADPFANVAAEPFAGVDFIAEGDADPFADAAADDPAKTPSPASADSSPVLDGGNGKIETSGDSLDSLWDETAAVVDPDSLFTPEDTTASTDTESVSKEQVENVVYLLLQGDLKAPLEASLEKMKLALTEEFVVRVIETCDIPVGNLLGFVKWAVGETESVKTSRVIELLSDAVCPEVAKEDACLVWDLVQEFGKVSGVLSTGVLNKVISMLARLGKTGMCHQVFEKFYEFNCHRDADTYYSTIQGIRRLGMGKRLSAVAAKMLEFGCLPDVEKTGEIVTALCKMNMYKEAHLVYMKAKEKKMCLPRSSFDILISGLSRKGKNVHLALRMLDDYPGESFEYSNKHFTAVVCGLCSIKDIKEAKKLLLKMADSGPPPGSASFNPVITALCKEGDMDDALALLKLMESRGLRPDVYTYTVIMSGFTKGGLMKEAHKVFNEAKKMHPKLGPVTYHILTRGYCRMEEYDKALGCLKEMRKDGVQPNVDEYEKMITTLCLKAVDWRTAEKLLKEMKDSGLQIKGRTRSLVAALKELAQEVPTKVEDDAVCSAK